MVQTGNIRLVVLQIKTSFASNKSATVIAFFIILSEKIWASLKLID